jgi:ribosomal protein L14E/L6E/L27E
MFEKGTVVLSLKGHDKGSYSVVAGIQEDGRILIADGKRRKLNAPKAKNPRHLEAQAQTVHLDEAVSDKALKKVLSGYLIEKA